MIGGSYVGQEVLFGIGLVLGLYFFDKRFWRELAMVAIGFGGGGLLWVLFSGMFDRHRPVFATPIWHVFTVPGFPSGHSFSAVVCYGFLAYLLAPRMPLACGGQPWSWQLCWSSVISATAGCFVGDHYLSDVLAGFAAGIAWAGLAYTSLEVLFSTRTVGHAVEQRTRFAES